METDMDNIINATEQNSATSNQSITSNASKRLKYTAIACDECKRRKIKCDGKAPCQRCVGHSSPCIYSRRGKNVASRQEFEMKKMSENMSKLQQQLDILVSSAAAGVPPGHQYQQNSLRSGNLTTSVSASIPPQRNNHTSLRPANNHNPRRARRSSRATRHTQYMGPTSSAYNLKVARTSLQDMGIQTGINHDNNSTRSHSATPARSPSLSSEVLFLRDPLLSITPDQAIRLVEIYEEEFGTMYPFIDINLVLETIEHFYSSATRAGETSAVQGSGNENMLSGGVVDIVKLVIAIALVIEHHGPISLSSELLENVESGFQGRPCGPTVDLLEIQAWTLMSILQFNCDEEALAWRTIGLAARAAVELGLHHRETYLFKFADSQKRLWANKLFWCIYILDRRWSFGTGLPFALHDDDIDPELSEENNSHPPLLKIMIAYGRLGSKVWKATCNLTTPITTDRQAFLEFQVGQWQTSILPDLQLQPSHHDMLDDHSRAGNRQRVLLYLLANQMRLLIFRPVLLSSKTIRNNNEGARKAVNIAKDTVGVLTRLNKISDIYASQQASFNYFLVSALTVMLLAVCHANAQFTHVCREEFYQGLELVRGFSSKSHVAQRLWKTVRYLKIAGSKLGLFPTRVPTYERPDGSHRSTAPHQPSSAPHVPITGFELVSDDSANLTFMSGISPSYSFSLDGNELSNDLTTIFETVEPSSGSIPILDTGITGIPGDFDFFNYGTPDALARSLFNLV